MEDHDFTFESESPEAADCQAAPAPATAGQPLALSNSHEDAPPFLDVLSFHSIRLLPVSRHEIAARERAMQKKNGMASYASPITRTKRGSSTALTPEEEAARLDELLASVHLLLEPIQLPDLRHTGVFDPATSLLRPAAPAGAAPTPEGERSTKLKLKLTKVDKSDDIKLFYPTGAKNANMRDYIKETIQKHLSSADLAQPPDEKALGTSASAPLFRSPGNVLGLGGQLRSTSPSKARALGKAAKKKSKLKSVKSPVKASLTTGALLNPQLTRQARDVIAAVRANSSKINELISK
jgi:hypothetical protein